MELSVDWDNYISERAMPNLGLANRVEFHDDALELANILVSRYHNAILSKGGAKSDETIGKCSLNVIFTELLKIASAKLRADIDSNAAKAACLGRYEYLLYRNFVETRGATREMDPRSHAWVIRMREENEYLCDKLDKLVEHWMQKKFFAHIFETSHITDQMKLVQHMLRLFMSQSRVQKEDIKCIYLKVVEVLVEFRQRTCEFVQPIYVTADTIVQAASQLIGIPASWVLNSYKPRLQDLRQRLGRRIPGHDHIIKAISNILSSPGSFERVRRPIASFFFLCDTCFWQNELFEALCEELFDSKDLLIKFDMSDYTDALPSQDSNGSCVRKRILDAVRSYPFCVLLLENVDKANKKTISFLCDILRGDRPTDNELDEYDFSNTLILMTSEVRKNVCKVWHCNCLDMAIKESGLKKMGHNCLLLAAFRQAKKSFVLDLLDVVDDFLSFNIIDRIDESIFTRMRLREATDVIGQERKLVVYASEAAIRSIKHDHLPVEPSGGAALRKWFEDHIVPKLYDIISEVNHDGFCTVHIDTLIGTNQLSYRLELDNTVDDYIVKDFTKFFNQLRSGYHRGKGIFNDFYHLEALNNGLMYLLAVSDTESFVCQVPVFKAMDDLISILFKYASDVPSGNIDSVPPLYIFRGETDRQLKAWEDAITRMRIDGLRTILYSNKVEYDSVNVIIEAVLGLSDACITQLPHLAKSFLLLGLRFDGKSDLLESLVEHSKTGHKRFSVISIDMEEHGDTGSLIQFISDSLTHPSSGTHGGYNLHPVTDCTPLPSILVLDQVEKAQIPVFCALLSILDHGILRSEDGKMFDFRKSVVVMMSNLGNKEILARTVGNSRNPGGTVTRMLTRQFASKVRSRFRTELLNYVDEILMFDPFPGNQLQKLSSLSLKVGRHLTYDDMRLDIPMALLVLFEEPDSQIPFAWQKRKVDFAVFILSRVIRKNWNDRLFKRAALDLGGSALRTVTSFEGSVLMSQPLTLCSLRW